MKSGDVPARLVPVERETVWGTKDPIPHFACPVEGCEFLAIDRNARCPYHHFPDRALTEAEAETEEGIEA